MGFLLVTLMSGFEWMCFMVIIRFPTKASVLPDNLLSTEVPLSSGETQILHLASSTPKLFRHSAVSQSCRKAGPKLYFSSHGLNLKGFISTNSCSRCRSGKIVREAGRQSFCSSRSGRTTLASKITLGHKQYFTITPSWL